MILWSGIFVLFADADVLRRVVTVEDTWASATRSIERVGGAEVVILIRLCKPESVVSGEERDLPMRARGSLLIGRDF